MLERTLYAVLLENPGTRVRHVSPAMRQAAQELIDKGLFTKDFKLTHEGEIAQRIVRWSNPRCARERCEDRLWMSIRDSGPLTDGHRRRKSAATAAIQTLEADGLIERDLGYNKGEAWRWRG